MTTHVLLITDKSGSMGPLAGDVINGFNSYLNDLESDADDWSISSTLFDTSVTEHCQAVSLAEVPRLNAFNYKPSGFTALLDAVYSSVTSLESKLEAMSDTGRVLVIVQTDGAENSSREVNFRQVSELIQRLEATGRWEFLFVGQGPGAWHTGRSSGFSNRVDTQPGGMSVNNSYGSYATASRAFRDGDSMAAVVDFMEQEHRKTGTMGSGEGAAAS